MWTRGRIQNHLGNFGFSGDEVRWSTATLSGGERAATKREQTRSAAKKAANAKRDAAHDARSARRAAESSEQEAHRLEARVLELQRALEDPVLYAGGAEAARRAGELKGELEAATREHDAALERWAEAVDALETKR